MKRAASGDEQAPRPNQNFLAQVGDFHRMGNNPVRNNANMTAAFEVFLKKGYDTMDDSTFQSFKTTIERGYGTQTAMEYSGKGRIQSGYPDIRNQYLQMAESLEEARLKRMNVPNAEQEARARTWTKFKGVFPLDYVPDDMDMPASRERRLAANDELVETEIKPRAAFSRKMELIAEDHEKASKLWNDIKNQSFARVDLWHPKLYTIETSHQMIDEMSTKKRIPTTVPFGAPEWKEVADELEAVDAYNKWGERGFDDIYYEEVLLDPPDHDQKWMTYTRDEAGKVVAINIRYSTGESMITMRNPSYKYALVMKDLYDEIERHDVAHGIGQLSFYATTAQAARSYKFNKFEPAQPLADDRYHNGMTMIRTHDINSAEKTTRRLLENADGDVRRRLLEDAEKLEQRKYAVSDDDDDDSGYETHETLTM
jgi:hypothetical protein